MQIKISIREQFHKNKSNNYNSNLTQLLNDNIRKELEIEKNSRMQIQLSQTRHRNELWQQVKNAQELKSQLNKSNFEMDEEYINM